MKIFIHHMAETLSKQYKIKSKRQQLVKRGLSAWVTSKMSLIISYLWNRIDKNLLECHSGETDNRNAE